MFESDALNGKTFSILGDSYSTFEGYIPSEYIHFYPRPESVSDVTCVEDTWWYQLLNQNKMKLLINNSFSGSTVCEQVRDGFPHTSAFSVRARDCSFGTSDHTSPDYLFVFGGTNDYWLGRAFGDVQFDGWSPETLQEVLPAYCYTLHNLAQRYPNATLVTISNDILPLDLKDGLLHASEHYKTIHVMLHDIDKQSGHPTSKGMAQIFAQVQEVLFNLH